MGGNSSTAQSPAKPKRENPANLSSLSASSLPQATGSAEAADSLFGAQLNDLSAISAEMDTTAGDEEEEGGGGGGGDGGRTGSAAAEAFEVSRGVYSEKSGFP